MHCAVLVIFFVLSLVISEYPQALRLLLYAPERILYSAVIQIPLKIHKEAIFPVALRNRTGLNLSHVQIVVDHMG